MKKAYRFAIVYFTLFGVLLLLSGVWLFALKVGFSIDAVEAYYLGSAEAYTQPKSVHGLLEIALPHLGAMGLFIMVTGHFLIFTPYKKRRFITPLLMTLFAAALLDTLTPFGIIAGFTLFVWFKFFAFILLQLLGMFLLWLVFNAAFLGNINRQKRRHIG